MIDVLKMENVKAGVKNQFHIIPASEWLQICTIQKGKDSVDDMYLENKYTRLIRQQKGIFINDHFIPLLEHTKGIMFLYGGYGSSKTTFAITKQLIKCIENDYHRCYYGRQKKTEARNLFSNIITEIKRNGWEHLFKFSDNPTGTTQIKCVLNNNKFEMFGCDDTDSLKGIDNPTDILVDEINQLTWESFGMLLTRLRGQGYETQFMGLFNNCDVFPDHWLSKYIFNENYGDEKNQKVIEALQKSHVVKHHSNYKHNLFQNADAYYYKLVNQAAGDQSKIDAYANGEWGVKINGMPYYKMFNKELHVRDCYYNPKLPIHFSFDENVNPYFPCLIAQIDGNDVYFIDEIAAVNPYNTLSGFVMKYAIDIKIMKLEYIYMEMLHLKKTMSK